MTDRHAIGGNNPPEPIDPIDAVIAEYDAVISEAQNWADGEPVTTEAQMLAVDAVISEFRTYRAALTKAAKERTDPLHKAWKAEVAAVKVYTDDADLMQGALVKCVSDFKTKRAEEKRAEERKAWEAAQQAKREAEEAARAANSADIDALREANALKQSAIDAEKAAKAQSKDAVKGMRTVHKFEIEDYSALLRWMNKEARADLEAAAREYVQRVHKSGVQPDGVKIWTEKEAY